MLAAPARSASIPNSLLKIVIDARSYVIPIPAQAGEESAVADNQHIAKADFSSLLLLEMT